MVPTKSKRVIKYDCVCVFVCVCASFVKTYDEAQDSTLDIKKRKIEEVTEVEESKPKKAKLATSTPTATISGAEC